MVAMTGSSTSLVGKTFDCAFDAFAPRLTVLSPTQLRVQARIGETDLDEVVENEITDLRPGLVVMHWTERSGTFVVQVQDHQNRVVHNYARLANGDIFRAHGVIQPVSSI